MNVFNYMKTKVKDLAQQSSGDGLGMLIDSMNKKNPNSQNKQESKIMNLFNNSNSLDKIVNKLKESEVNKSEKHLDFCDDDSQFYYTMFLELEKLRNMEMENKSKSLEIKQKEMDSQIKESKEKKEQYQQMVKEMVEKQNIIDEKMKLVQDPEKQIKKD